MTEAEIITMLSDTLGAVVVPEPLLDQTDPAVIAWASWNRSRPRLDLNKVKNQRDSYVRHSRKRAWWVA